MSSRTPSFRVQPATLSMFCVSVIVGGILYYILTTIAQEPLPSSSTTYTPPASSTYTPPPSDSSYSMPSGSTYSMPSGSTYSMPSGSTYSMPSGSPYPMPTGTNYSMPSGNIPCGPNVYPTAQNPCTPSSTNYSMPSGNIPCGPNVYPTAQNPCMPSGSTYSMPSDCSQQPNWPDCATFSCTAGNWTCTGMKPRTATPGGTTAGSTASSFSSQPAGMPPCAAGQMPTAANPCFFNPMGNTSSAPGGGMSGMRNCQYPTARVMENGQEVGLSVWCESDYVNCRKGSSSGPAISHENLRSLGAPSACESGWNGGASGTSGGMTGNSGMCDYYPTGQMPSSCMFSTPACLMVSEIAQSVNCGESKCTSAWHHTTGGPSCWSPGDYPGKSSGYQGDRYTPPYGDYGKYPSDGTSLEACNKGCDAMKATMVCTGQNGLSMCTQALASCKDGCSRTGNMQSQGYTQPNFPYTNPSQRDSGMPYPGNQYPMGNQGINSYPGNYGQYPPYGDYNGGFYPVMMNYGWQDQPGNGQQNQEQREAQQKKMYKEQQTRMHDQMKSEGVRQCQRFLDPLQSAIMPKAMQDAIRGYHKRCVDGVQTSVSPQEFYKLMESLRTEMMGLFEKTESCDGVESFIYGMEQGAMKEAPRFIKQTQKKNPALAKQMEQMRQATIAAVNAAKKQVAGGDCGTAQETMETMQQKFEDASRTWGDEFSMDEFSMLDDDRMTDHFSENMRKHGVNISAADLKRYGIADTEHFDVMSKLMTYGGKGDMDRFFDDEDSVNMIKTLKAVGGTSDQTSIMAQIMKENKRLKEEVNDLRAQLNKTQAALADRLSSLTADTEIASQIKDYVMNKLPDTVLTQKESDKIYDAFKIANGRELMKKHLVTNPDLDPIEWFTPSVIKANKAGFMKGDPTTGLFRPTDEMNQAEAAVTMARAFGVEVTEGAVPSDKKFAGYPEWSLSSLQALEENDIDLTVLSKDADKAISREQVAVLLSTLLPDEASEEKYGKVFTDLSGANAETTAAIEELSALGIVNGVNNGSTYDLKGEVNRATFATYLTRAVGAAEAFLGVDAAVKEDAVGVPSN